METKLYVGNLSYNSSREDIQNLFEEYGKVSDVFIVKDRESGRPRGFAFVTMDTKESMLAAIEGLNGKEFMGRALAINEARPREDREQKNFRGKDSGSDSFRRRDDRGYRDRRDR